MEMECIMSSRIERILTVLLMLSEICIGCPISCVCKWKNGKQTVECVNKGLIVIPEGMDSGTQVLEFSGNNLQALHRDKFLKMDLINLQRIYLPRCQIAAIEDRTFNGLTNLVELDLSGNLLEVVPSEAFVDCPSLMRLTLSGNPIKSVRKSAFGHLSFLNTLELSSCDITLVEEGAFHGLYSLEWLFLDGNKLTSLRGTKYFPDSLKGLQLQDNPWKCDCHIEDLHAWLRVFSIPLSTDPICELPGKLRGRKIKSLPSTELACLPDVSPTTFYLEIGEGKNISMFCQVHAIPEARVSWWFKGQLLQNDTVVAPGVHLLYYVEEGAMDKRSELFIYNTNTDDNGTFICNAENPAGTSQANFTIRVIVKQDTASEVPDLPFEFILIIMSSAIVSLSLLIVIMVISIVRCHRSSRLGKKRNSSKMATKDNLLQESFNEYSDSLKESAGNLKLTDSSGEEETSLKVEPTANQVRSPSSRRRHHPEQNPDLINDTAESGIRRECDGQEHKEIHSSASPTVKAAFPQSIASDLYMLPPDIHLNPIGLLQPSMINCYRTLPYNKKRHMAPNQCRYTREAEFLSHSPDFASLDSYRHTADGYPPPVFSHQPLGRSFSTSTAEPCCSSSVVQWPSCVPGRFVRTANVGILKKCVGAQTQTECDVNVRHSVVNPVNKSLTSVVKIHDTVVESPDEGYEGDSVDTSTSAC